MTKNQNNKEKIEILRKINRQNINKSYFVLYSIIVFIVIVGELFLYFVKGFEFLTFFQDIVESLMGVLVAFLLFDVFHKKISKDSYALEMSQQILDHLMANTKALSLFSEEQREHFIESTISSLVDDPDATEMINNNVLKYLAKNKQYRIRTSFDYRFDIQKNLPSTYEHFLTSEKYFYVQELLSYDIKYLTPESKNINGNTVSMFFSFNNQNLDKMLRKKDTLNSDLTDCIFREGLDVHYDDRCAFLSLQELPLDQRKKRIIELLKPDVQINNHSGEVSNVIVDERGIIIQFKIDIDPTLMEHNIRIIFYIPKRHHSLLEIAIIEPTKNPKITVSYPEDSLYVEMFPFLNDDEDSSIETTHRQINGIYDISLNKNWIYPISGIIFSIHQKE